jgi:hypothetical protein
MLLHSKHYLWIHAAVAVADVGTLQDPCKEWIPIIKEKSGNFLDDLAWIASRFLKMLPVRAKPEHLHVTIQPTSASRSVSHAQRGASSSVKNDSSITQVILARCASAELTKNEEPPAILLDRRLTRLHALRTTREQIDDQSPNTYCDARRH